MKAINSSLAVTAVDRDYKEGKTDLMTKIIWDKGYNDAAQRILSYLKED